MLVLFIFDTYKRHQIEMVQFCRKEWSQVNIVRIIKVYPNTLVANQGHLIDSLYRSLYFRYKEAFPV